MSIKNQLILSAESEPRFITLHTSIIDKVYRALFNLINIVSVTDSLDNYLLHSHAFRMQMLEC